jgi:hypothetical protein
LEQIAVIIRVRTNINQALNKLPAPVVALMVDHGWLTEWPLELTRLGKRMAQVKHGRAAPIPTRSASPRITGALVRFRPGELGSGQ